MHRILLSILLLIVLSCDETQSTEANDCDNSNNPNISLLYPTSGQTLDGNINITVAATSDNGIERVDFIIDGVTVYSDSLLDYAYQWDSTESDSGSHTITILAYDECNNFSTAGPINISIDNDETAPSVDIVSPYNNETVAGIYTIQISVSDNREMETVYLYINDAIVDTLDSEPYSYLWDTTQEQEDTNYTIHSTAIDQAGNSATSEAVIVYLNNVPEQPQVSVSVSDNSEYVSLSWTSIPIAELYRIYRDSEFVNETSSTNWSETLVPYTEYCYQVSAISNLDVEGELSDSKCGTTGNTPLNAPTMNLTSDYHEISISWSNIEGAVSYNIYLTNPASGLLANTTDLFYVDTGLAYDTYRCYKISAIDSWEDEGGQSSQYCQSTYSEPSPEPPTNVNISVSGDYLQLTWTLSISNNADAYFIYKNNTQVSEVGNNVTTYDDGDYKYDDYFTYYVQVKSESGLTNQSEQVSITAPNNPNYYDIQVINQVTGSPPCEVDAGWTYLTIQLYANDAGGTQYLGAQVDAGLTQSFYDIATNGQNIYAVIDPRMGGPITGNFTLDSNKIITVTGNGYPSLVAECGELAFTVTNP